MKAITIKQPWAELIVEGVKDIENRTWKCPKKYIGQRVLIHAGSNNHLMEIPPSTFMSGDQCVACNNVDFKRYALGAIIGSVEIVDCVVNHPSVWADKSGPSPYDGPDGCVDDGSRPTYNWVLANPIKFPEPIPVKGKLSFWDYPNILAEQEEKNGELFCHCQIPIDEKIQVMAFDGDCTCRYCGGRWYK